MINSPAFSRSKNTCAFGKCDEDVKTKVPGFVKDTIITEASRSVQPTSEYTRDIYLKYFFGQVGFIKGKPVKDRSHNIEDLINALAVLNEMSVPEYKEKVMYEHVYGHVDIMHLKEINEMPQLGQE